MNRRRSDIVNTLMYIDHCGHRENHNNKKKNKKSPSQCINDMVIIIVMRTYLLLLLLMIRVMLVEMVMGKMEPL